MREKGKNEDGRQRKKSKDWGDKGENLSEA